MNLLFLCKRFPQGRDLLTRPYGRFYHVPKYLAARGHRVHVALLSYKGIPSAEESFDGITWSSDDLWPRGLRGYLARQEAIAKTLSPDWVIGLSDTYFGIMARRLATRHGARAAVDAYDDFEAYMPWAKPLHFAWRRALTAADLVTVAGPQLARKLETRGVRHAHVLPMAADPQFQPLDRQSCRELLGLPADRKLIGHIGAFDRRRGRGVVLQALARTRKAHANVSLVLSGRASLRFHAPPDIVSAGFVPDDRVPALVNSLDVACVALADNAFGRSSYPAKICEAMACGIPIVATDLENTRWMLRGDERYLAEVGNPEAMAERIAARLNDGRADYGEQPTWPEVAAALESLLETGMSAADGSARRQRAPGMQSSDVLSGEPIST